MSDLPIIQKTYDLIKWYILVLDRLPRNHRFTLGDRVITGLYDISEGLIKTCYATERLFQLKLLNIQLDILRHQTRLLLDFELIKSERYEYASKLLNEVGIWVTDRGLQRSCDRHPPQNPLLPTF